MKTKLNFFLLLISVAFFMGCSENQNKSEITAKDILENPEYLAISYGG